MLYDRLKKAYRASTLIAGLMALALVGTISIVPMSSAHAQISSYQTARHVFPWAQQQRRDYTPGYYSDESSYFHDHRGQVVVSNATSVKRLQAHLKHSNF